MLMRTMPKALVSLMCSEQLTNLTMIGVSIKELGYQASMSCLCEAMLSKQNPVALRLGVLETFKYSPVKNVLPPCLPLHLSVQNLQHFYCAAQ
jgi:hypothetical protein